MKALALVAILVPAGLVGQERAHVHGGHAACYAVADWQTQERVFLAGDVSEWNRLMRPMLDAGRCWLTEDGGAYELAESAVPGTSRIRPASDPAQKGEPRWSVVSLRALREP